MTAPHAEEMDWPGLLDSATDGLLVVSSDALMDYASRPLAQMFGYAVNELQGQPLDLLIPEPHKAAHAVQVRHFIDAPRHRVMGDNLPLSGRRKDGTVFPVSISLGPTPAGRVVAVVRDLTAEAAMRLRLREAQQAVRYERSQLALYLVCVAMTVLASLVLVVGIRQVRASDRARLQILRSTRHVDCVVQLGAPPLTALQLASCPVP